MQLVIKRLVGVGWPREVVAMASPQMSEALVQVWRGHALLLGCSCLYLAWWVVFFRPGAPQVEGVVRVLGVAAIVGAVVCGVAGGFTIGGSLAALPGADGVPRLWFVVGGVAAYAALLAVTTLVFRRQVTTELVLIVAWGALEACVTASLAAAGALDARAASALYVLVALLVAASLVCYVLYYRLGPVASFVDGMVPLVAVGIESAVVLVLVG